MEQQEERMSLLDTGSLAATLDAINEALFYRRRISNEERKAAARWIAGRQGLPGSYADTFAPTEEDLNGIPRVFTGEKPGSLVSASHILGEEACRALTLLDVADREAEQALERARHGIMSRLPKQRPYGMYCCGTCTPAFWRHMTAKEPDGGEECLTAGVQVLRSMRAGNSKWRVFPFYYTLLALSEMELPGAIEEMRYAAPVCERYVKRSPRDDRVSQRRRRLSEMVLSRC
jgi:hypothetical protein